MTFREHIYNAMQKYTHVKSIPEGDYTIGAFISAVMEIDNEAEAEQFWHGYVDYMTIAYPETPTIPACQSNVGWCFGEGMSEDKKAMWIKVSDASHPVFGQMKPTVTEAFEAGKAWADGN